MQYGNPEEDKFFEIRGVKPPERIPHLTDDERDNLLKHAYENHHCQWRQRGNIIFCDADNFEHGKKISSNMRLTGQSAQGLPILQPIVLSK